MGSEVQTLVQILSQAPCSGSFKPTCYMTAGRPELARNRDYVRVRGQSALSVSRGDNLVDTLFSSGCSDNTVVVVGHTVERATTVPIWFGLSSKTEYTPQQMVTMVVYPGSFNQREGYSIDVRTNSRNQTRGTAHLQMSYELDSDQYRIFFGILNDCVGGNSALINDALLHLTFAPSGSQERTGASPINIYQGFTGVPSEHLNFLQSMSTQGCLLSSLTYSGESGSQQHYPQFHVSVIAETFQLTDYSPFKK